MKEKESWKHCIPVNLAKEEKGKPKIIFSKNSISLLLHAIPNINEIPVPICNHKKEINY
jgi:hypothetical protein